MNAVCLICTRTVDAVFSVAASLEELGSDLREHRVGQNVLFLFHPLGCFNPKIKQMRPVVYCDEKYYESLQQAAINEKEG